MNSLIRIRKKDYFREFIFNHRRDSRAMWCMIDNCSGCSCLSVPCFSNMTADDLTNFFVNLGPNTVRNISPRNSFSKCLHKRILSSFYLKPVTNHEILAIAKLLPSKTSCDCDSLSMKIVKYFISSIVDPLCFIFNKSFTKGIFPTALKISKIVPIFKSGDKADIKNYRPISILPVFSKILEKLILIRLSVFFNKYNVLNIN